MAEAEREFIQERTLVGLDTAAANGKHGGRPPAVDGDDACRGPAAPRREGVRHHHRVAPRRRPLHPDRPTAMCPGQSPSLGTSPAPAQARGCRDPWSADLRYRARRSRLLRGDSVVTRPM
ncbi:hypothetical protein ACODT4_39550 [Streptomyces sp. 2.9]